MKRQYFYLGGITLLLLVLVACSPADEPRLTYTIGECDQSIPMDQLADWAGLDIAAQDGVVQIRQNINYVCCAEIKVEMEREANVVKLIETNVGEVCKCMCGYEGSMEITGLPTGRYTIQVWGVQCQDVHSLELLGEAQIEL